MNYLNYKTFKTMKKFFLILFATMLVGQAWAQQNFDFSAKCSSGQTLYYKITSSTEPYSVQVTYAYYKQGTLGYSYTDEYYYNYTEPEGYLVIPNTVTNGTITYSVTSIGDDAFCNCRRLNSVIIPHSVISIGTAAFYRCDILEWVVIPKSASVGPNAFYRQTGSITQYKEGASTNSSIYQDNMVYLITSGNEATLLVYYGNEENVIIPEKIKDYNVSSIGKYALCNCDNLTTVTIPNTITAINEFAFADCSKLTSVAIPNTVTSIGDKAFSGCEGLSIVIIPNSVETIGYYAFNNGKISFYCESRNIPSGWVNDFHKWNGGNGTVYWGTKIIGDYAYKLDNNTIPRPLKIFRYIYDSAVVVIPSTTIVDGVEYTITGLDDNAFCGCTNLTSVTIPGSITNIGNGVFANCTNLDYTLSKGCKYIGNEDNIYYALLGVNSTAITSVEINSNCKVICGGAFSGCGSLAELTIPDGVVSIGNYAFSDCSALTSVTIPNTVTMIDDYAFSGCGVLSSIDISNSVENIGRYAFSDCSGLTSITLPTSVKSIGANAFNNCNNITTVTIPNSVISIGANAFNNCTNIKTLSYNTNAVGNLFSAKAMLETVNIGNDVTTISENAFKGCEKLTSITIPSSITSVGKNAFNGCVSLTAINTESNVDFRGSNLRFTKDSIGYAVLRKDSVEVVSNSYLTKAVIPASVSFGNTFAVTGISDNAFKGNGITSVNIPNTITVIGSSAFENCKYLTSVTIPESVKNIGANAFKNCNGLETTNISASTIEIGNGAFAGCSNVKNYRITQML